MASQEYEYVAVQLGLGPNEKKMTQKINEVAAHGWRLVFITTGAHGSDKLIFERPFGESGS